MAEGLQPEQLIAAYCDLNGVFQAVWHKQYSTATTLIRQAMDAIIEEQTEPDDLAILVNCFQVVLQYHIFYRLLDALDCELTDTPEARAALIADYHQWKAGGSLSDVQWMNQTHPAVKIRLFKAMDALSLAPEEFDELPPADCKAPRWQKKNYGEFELVTIADAEIVDDGGFTQDIRPNGESFDLTDSDGVIYHLRNVHRSAVAGGLYTGEAKHYSATGWIDGYTGKMERDIELERYEDGGFMFSYSTDGTDDDDTPIDPRWAAYEAWADARIEARRARQAAWVAQYRNKS